MSVVEIPRRLAVVDDDPDSGASIQRRLRTKGYDVELVTPPSSDMQETVREIKRVADAALCDHRLKDGLQVAFSGAELVAELTEQGFPAVLFTGVQPDEKYAIRRSIDRIPGFLDRDDEGGLRAPRLLSALQDSVDEVLGLSPPPRRRARRTPVTVTGSRRTGGQALVEVRISGWSGAPTLELPVEILPEPWRTRPGEAEGKTFFAWCNIGETDERRVFVRDLEPEPLETETFFDTHEA